MPKLVTFAPTTALYAAPNEAGTFYEDVARFGRMLKGTLEEMPKVKAGGTLKDLAEVRRRGLAGEPVSYDIETLPEHPDRPWTGKDPTRAQIKAIGFGFTDWAFAFFWDDLPLRAAAIEILTDPRILKVGTNVVWYDNRVLKRAGVVVRNFEDCRDLRRALSSTSRLSLAYMGSLYTDYFAWKEKQSYDDGK